MVIFPGWSPMASAALITRFRTSCRMCVGSAATRGRSFASSRRNSILAGIATPIRPPISRTRSDTCSGFTPPLLLPYTPSTAASGAARHGWPTTPLPARSAAWSVGQRLQRKARIAHNCGQQVIEIVRDTAGQQPQRIEPLPAQELRLQIFAFRQIQNESDTSPFGRRVQQHAANPNRNQAAVFTQ